jgi:hypothetical protein
MNLYQDIFNLLESKTSKAFRAMDAQREKAHREKHGRPRTKEERKQHRKEVGAEVRSNIEWELMANKKRDDALKYGGGTGGIPPSTTRSRIEGQRAFYNHINRQVYRQRKGKYPN